MLSSLLQALSLLYWLFLRNSPFDNLYTITSTCKVNKFIKYSYLHVGDNNCSQPITLHR